MDKVELIRHEIEKRRVHNLAIGNPLFAAMAEEDIELLSFIDSMKEEPVSKDFCEMADKYYKDVLIGECQMEESMAGHCRLSYYQGLKDGAQMDKKEPVSEDLEEEIRKYFLAYKGYPHIMDKTEREMKKACIHFANWQKNKILKEGEDAIQYVKENHSPSEVSDFQNAMNISVMKAFDAGKEEVMQQIMKDAIEIEVKIDAGGYPYIPAIELYDYDNEVFLACEGDKVKVKIIKED